MPSHLTLSIEERYILKLLKEKNGFEMENVRFHLLQLEEADSIIVAKVRFFLFMIASER